MLLNIEGMVWQRYEHVASIMTPKEFYSLRASLVLPFLSIVRYKDCILTKSQAFVEFLFFVCVLFPDHVATFFPHITSLFYIPFQAEYAFHVKYIILKCVMMICFEAVCTLMIYHIGFELGSR